MNNIWDNVWLWIPVNTWFVVQCMKIIIELIKSKKLNLRRIVGSGGMPSSHSAFVCSLATTIGITEGVSSPLFAMAVALSAIVMYDAAGVRRAAGKQAAVLNKIIDTPGLTGVQVREKLVEALGHTPVQVFVGALIGVVVGVIA